MRHLGLIAIHIAGVLFVGVGVALITMAIHLMYDMIDQNIKRTVGMDQKRITKDTQDDADFMEKYKRDREKMQR